jgi:hypothetical protein
MTVPVTPDVPRGLVVDGAAATVVTAAGRVVDDEPAFGGDVPRPGGFVVAGPATTDPKGPTTVEGVAVPPLPSATDVVVVTGRFARCSRRDGEDPPPALTTAAVSTSVATTAIGAATTRRERRRRSW